jgi:hypothetical protein
MNWLPLDIGNTTVSYWYLAEQTIGTIGSKVEIRHARELSWRRAAVIQEGNN